MAVVRLETAEESSSEGDGKVISAKNSRSHRSSIFRTKMPMKLDFIFAIADKLPESMKQVTD